MPDEIRAVEFVAEVRQIKSMADGTANITLNLPEYCVDQAAWFLKHQGDMIHGVVELSDDNGRKQNKSKAGSNY